MGGSIDNPDRLTATLDQSFRQFFLLAPRNLPNELFASLFARRFSHPLTLHRSSIDSEFAFEDAMQPDLLFVSGTEVVAVEMKITATCILSQVPR